MLDKVLNKLMHPLNQPTPHYVQACITNVSFPQDLEGLRQMLHKNRGIGEGLTDVDTLVSFPNLANMWTASRWMTSGDLLFFYHAASAPYRIGRLQRELRKQAALEQHERRELTAVLERATAQAQARAGHVFAVAEISGTSLYERLDKDERHFQGRIFALFETVHHLERTVSLDQLAAIGISINRQGAVTPLEGEQLSRLKELLGKVGRLPAYVANALPGGTGFRGVNASTWRAISCALEQRFIHEGQVRTYLIDYLLDELKDHRTSILEECDCFRQTTYTGRADYFISLGGQWLPVEAKLNIQTERDVMAQLAQYSRISSFTPTRGPRRGVSFPTKRNDVCLVIDQLGLYITRAGAWVECSQTSPFLSRSALGQLSGEATRARLLSVLGNL